MWLLIRCPPVAHVRDRHEPRGTAIGGVESSFRVVQSFDGGGDVVRPASGSGRREAYVKFLPSSEKERMR